MKAAKSLRVAADEMRELEKLAEPLMPKRIVIKEEQENSAPMGDANAVPFQNSDEHDVRELLDWDEVDKVFFLGKLVWFCFCFEHKSTRVIQMR